MQDVRIYSVYACTMIVLCVDTVNSNILHSPSSPILPPHYQTLNIIKIYHTHTLSLSHSLSLSLTHTLPTQGPAAELGMTVGRLIGFRCLKGENSQRQLILAAAGTYVQTLLSVHFQTFFSTLVSFAVSVLFNCIALGNMISHYITSNYTISQYYKSHQTIWYFIVSH